MNGHNSRGRARPVQKDAYLYREPYQQKRFVGLIATSADLEDIYDYFMSGDGPDIEHLFPQDKPLLFLVSTDEPEDGDQGALS